MKSEKVKEEQEIKGLVQELYYLQVLLLMVEDEGVKREIEEDVQLLKSCVLNKPQHLVVGDKA